MYLFYLQLSWILLNPETVSVHCHSINDFFGFFLLKTSNLSFRLLPLLRSLPFKLNLSGLTFTGWLCRTASAIARVILRHVDGTTRDFVALSLFFFSHSPVSLLRRALHLLTMLLAKRQTSSWTDAAQRVQAAILHAQLEFPRVFRASRLATNLLSRREHARARKGITWLA